MAFPILSICIFALSLELIHSQMMPEYDDYPNPMDRDRGDRDYPQSPHDHLTPPDYGHGPHGMARQNEIVVGSKRFKLYERKRLNFKRAKEFCRKKEGRLAEAQTLDEMRRLEGLFAKARMVGMDVWVGADKKKWKKHSMKNFDHPGLNLNKSGMENAGIKATMMGGGQKEMCPAISLSTRNLAPVICAQPLPFICEYDKNRPRTTRKPKPKNGPNKVNKKSKKKTKRKDEMKK